MLGKEPLRSIDDHGDHVHRRLQIALCQSPFRRPELSRRESGVSDRHGRSAGATQRFNLGVELISEGVDDAGAEPSFWLSKDAVRRASSVVGDREFPIRSGHIERDGNLPIFGRAVECMLDRIEQKPTVII